MDPLILLGFPLAAVLGLFALFTAAIRLRTGRPPFALSAALALAALALLVARARYLGPCSGPSRVPPRTPADSLLNRVAPGFRLPTRVCDAEALLPGTATTGYGIYTLRRLPGYLNLTVGQASTRGDDAASDDRLPSRPRGLLMDFHFWGTGPLPPLEDTLRTVLGQPTLALCMRSGTLGTSRALVWQLRDATITLGAPPDHSERAESLGRLPPSAAFSLLISQGRTPLLPGLAEPCEWKRPA